MLEVICSFDRFVMHQLDRYIKYANIYCDSVSTR